jgi:enoyl-CoA hydratase/carnithine racemase
VPHYETILVQLDGGVATLTLNRPDRRNAIDLRMDRELQAALHALDQDEAVRAIVVTGAGSAFCAGVDLSAGADVFGSAAHERHDRELGANSDTIGQRYAIWQRATPVIGAINGAAVGAGLTLALLFDIRYVAQDAKLSFPFTRLGILPDANVHWILPRIVGVSRALELLLSGRTFSGVEAAAMGLASQALPKEDVLEAARALARDLAENTAPASVAMAKRLVYENLGETDRLAAMARETRLVWWLGEQPDAAEGVRARLERRTPAWRVSKHLKPPEKLS